MSYRFGVIAAYCSNFGHFAFLSHPLRGLRTTYDVHLRLIGKRVVDFLLVLIEIIELFSLGVTSQALRAKIDRSSNVVTLAHPLSHSSLKVNNRSFRHASPCLCMECTSQRTSPTCRWWVPVTVISSFSHQFIIIIIITTATMHHFISVSLDSKLTFSINPSHRSLPRIFGRISRIFMTISGLICLLFCFVLLFSSILFDSYDRLSWFW